MSAIASKQAHAWRALGLGPRWRARALAVPASEPAGGAPHASADDTAEALSTEEVEEAGVPAPVEQAAEATVPIARTGQTAQAGEPMSVDLAAQTADADIGMEFEADLPRAGAAQVPVPRGGSAPADPERRWALLREQVLGCRACTLCETRRQAVFGVGDERADWLIVGEAPGAEEDRRGEPFVGEAGLLLDQMLAAIGRSRAKGVYILNVLKCRPPNNRDPLPEEVASCRNYLEAQVGHLRPTIILAVGRFAAHALLGSDASIGSLRGRTHHAEIAGLRVPVVVTYHPAYYLRRPEHKRMAWDDLNRMRRLAREIAADSTT